MADGFIPLPPDGVGGRKLDTEELTVGVNTVHRERMQLVGATATAIVAVGSATPSSSAFGVTTREAPPANPNHANVTPATVNAGSSGNFDSPDLDGKKLEWVDVWMSQSWRAEIRTIDNGVASAVKGVFGARGWNGVQYRPVHKDYFALGSTGTNGWRVVVFNHGTENVDAYVTFHYSD